MKTHTCFPSLAVLALVGLTVAACGDGADDSDAFGNFEADEILVSAEASGKLIRFVVNEGESLHAGVVVGLVDTMQAALNKRQLEARRRAVRAKIGQVLSEIDVLEEQRGVLETERTRIENLLAANAATGKQLDDVEGQIRVINRRVASIRTQNASILADIEALDAQIALVEDQLAKSRIVNPIHGTVLETYVDQYEVTGSGRPLYKIADLDTLVLRAYVSGGQLTSVTLGEKVVVRFDRDADSIESRDGTVSWIAAEAEFTPKMVQTREERVNQVYAFQVRVPNPDGALKIGMPGEVVFSARSIAK